MRFFSVLFFVVLLSLLSSFFIFLEKSSPPGYETLFLLPLAFAIVSVLFNKLYSYIPDNLAITLIVFLSFCRMVIAPFFLSLGGYSSPINLNIENNLFHAILLMAYEFAAVMGTLFFFCLSGIVDQQKVVQHGFLSLSRRGKYTYIFFVLISILILACCFYIAPFLKEMYRSITQIGDEFFVNYEDSYIITKYATNFTSRLGVVVGMYLMRAMLIILPALIIVLCHESKSQNVFVRFISVICCFVPFFFIGGAIARSLIYVVCLLLLRGYLYGSGKFGNKILALGVLCVMLILVWWLVFNVKTSLSFYETMSTRLSAYFSGVNIVSGVFNLPNELDYRIRYFSYDFIATIPFGHTIFGVSNQNIQEFFNSYNYSQGQIPTTIGMGYYYFGNIFAPVYSMIFAYLAYRSFHLLEMGKVYSPFQYIRLLYSIFVFSMGIVMYNIEITMILVFSVLIPMYILERLAYDSPK